MEMGGKISQLCLLSICDSEETTEGTALVFRGTCGTEGHCLDVPADRAESASAIEVVDVAV